MARPMSRAWAFLLTLVAAAALILPIVYTSFVWRDYGPFGTLIAWTAVSVSIFGVLTLLVSVMRAFVAPTLNGTFRRRNGNL